MNIINRVNNNPENIIIKKEDDVKKLLYEGVKLMYDVVSNTLGPYGKTVIIESGNRKSIVTKDGVTILKNIYSNDSIENIALELCKQASNKMLEDVGDGTTTTTILLKNILEFGIEVLKQNKGKYIPSMVAKGMEVAVNEVINYVNDNKFTIDTSLKTSIGFIKNVVNVATNYDKVATDLIMKAYSYKMESNDNIEIDVVETNINESYVTSHKGMVYDAGFMSPLFINDNVTNSCIFDEETGVLILNYDVRGIQNIIPILEKFASSENPLVIFVNDIDQNTLKGVLANITTNGLKIAFIKNNPAFDIRKYELNDLSHYTGATILNKGDEISLAHVGILSYIKIQRYKSLLKKHDEIDIRDYAESIKKSFEEGKFNSIDRIVDENYFNRRISNLTGSIATIHIGSNSEVERKELYDRVEDGVFSLKHAISSGIIPGGGTTFLRSYKYLLDKTDKEEDVNIKIGMLIISSSLTSILERLLESRGDIKSDIEIIQSVLKDDNFNVGYNLITGEISNLLIAGIIEAFDIFKYSLLNASSVAKTILFSSSIIKN